MNTNNSTPPAGIERLLDRLAAAVLFLKVGATNLESALTAESVLASARRLYPSLSFAARLVVVDLAAHPRRPATELIDTFRLLMASLFEMMPRGDDAQDVLSGDGILEEIPSPSSPERDQFGHD